MTLGEKSTTQRPPRNLHDKGGNMRSLKFRITPAAAAFIVSTAIAQPPDTPTATPASASAMTVYDTALTAGWQNWSWAKTELSVELNGSARKPIRVIAGPWEAL